MGDVYDKATRSRVMSAVKSSSTAPEVRLRKLLHAKGYRYLINNRGLPGKPDLVFPKRRKVIFVHGCFWHQHRGCPHSTRPSSNTDYWNMKLDRNVKRDNVTVDRIQALGWRALVVWECEVNSGVAILTAERFLNDLNSVQ